MLGIIGVGAAGGNIADEAITKGIPSIVINYSQKDVDSLEHVEERLVLVGSEGVGKNRNTAINLMKNNWEMATEFVKTHMSTPSIEVILVCFSTAGGSGSGISPILLEILQQEIPDKTFVACPILPDKSEVIINQINCLETLDELSKLDLCVLPLDNEKIKLLYGNVPKNKIYNLINKEFINLLVNLTSYTDKSSKNGVLDRKDLLQIFNTKGIGLITETNLVNIASLNLSESQFTSNIQKSWETSIFSPFEYTQVIRAGVVFDGNISLLEYLKYDYLFNSFKNGMPIDLFEGIYSESKGKVMTMLAGISWINSRLSEIEQIINEKKHKVDLNEERTFQPKTNFRDFTSKVRQKVVNKKSASDILSKYNR